MASLQPQTPRRVHMEGVTYACLGLMSREQAVLHAVLLRPGKTASSCLTPFFLNSFILSTNSAAYLYLFEWLLIFKCNSHTLPHEFQGLYHAVKKHFDTVKTKLLLKTLLTLIKVKFYYGFYGFIIDQIQNSVLFHNTLRVQLTFLI